MKILKRFISSICAISMIAAVSISAVTVHADTNPTVSAKLLDYAADTGIGTVAVYLEGMQTGKFDFPFLTSFQAKAYMPETDFYIKDRTTKFNVTSTIVNNMPSTPTVAYSDSKLVYAWLATGTSLYVPASTIGDKGEIFKFNFKVKDTTKTNTIKIDEVAFNVKGYSEEDLEWADYVGNQDYSQVLNNVTVDDSDLTIKGGDITIEIPANGGATADSSAILNVKPSDVGGTGDVWASADGSENAVAGLANFTPSTATSTIEWTISATPVGGEAKQYTKAFDLGASIDAAATIGLIVNYNTAEYSSVSIVSGALK